MLRAESIVLDELSADPGSPGDGQVWFNTTTNQLKARISGVTKVLAFTPHATDHEENASDELTVQNLGSGAAAVDKIFVTDGTGGVILEDKPVGGGVYGADYTYTSSEAESSTTAQTYQQKVRLSVNVPAGDYRVGWSSKFRMSSSSAAFLGRIQLDDSIDLAIIHAANTGADVLDAYPWSGFEKVTLAAGSHTFDVDYASESAGKTATIKESRIEIWRVS